MRALSRVPCSRPLHPGHGACGQSSAERPPGTDPRLSSVSRPGLGESQQHLLSRPSGTGGKRSADSHAPAPQGEAPWLPGRCLALPEFSVLFLGSEAAELCVFSSPACSLETRFKQESGAHNCLSSWRSVLCTSFPMSGNYFFKCFVWFVWQQRKPSPCGFSRMSVGGEHTLGQPELLTGRD